MKLRDQIRALTLERAWVTALALIVLGCVLGAAFGWKTWKMKKAA